MNPSDAVKELEQGVARALEERDRAERRVQELQAALRDAIPLLLDHSSCIRLDLPPEHAPCGTCANCRRRALADRLHALEGDTDE